MGAFVSSPPGKMGRTIKGKFLDYGIWIESALSPIAYN